MNSPRKNQLKHTLKLLTLSALTTFHFGTAEAKQNAALLFEGGHGAGNSGETINCYDRPFIEVTENGKSVLMPDPSAKLIKSLGLKDIWEGGAKTDYPISPELDAIRNEPIEKIQEAFLTRIARRTPEYAERLKETIVFIKKNMKNVTNAELEKLNESVTIGIRPPRNIGEYCYEEQLVVQLRNPHPTEKRFLFLKRHFDAMPNNLHRFLTFVHEAMVYKKVLESNNELSMLNEQLKQAVYDLENGRKQDVNYHLATIQSIKEKMQKASIVTSNELRPFLYGMSSAFYDEQSDMEYFRYLRSIGHYTSTYHFSGFPLMRETKPAFFQAITPQELSLNFPGIPNINSATAKNRSVYDIYSDPEKPTLREAIYEIVNLEVNLNGKPFTLTKGALEIPGNNLNSNFLHLTLQDSTPPFSEIDLKDKGNRKLGKLKLAFTNLPMETKGKLSKDDLCMSTEVNILASYQFSNGTEWKVVFYGVQSKNGYPTCTSGITDAFRKNGKPSHYGRLELFNQELSYKSPGEDHVIEVSENGSTISGKEFMLIRNGRYDDLILRDSLTIGRDNRISSTGTATLHTLIYQKITGTLVRINENEIVLKDVAPVRGNSYFNFTFAGKAWSEDLKNGTWTFTSDGRLKHVRFQATRNRGDVTVHIRADQFEKLPLKNIRGKWITFQFDFEIGGSEKKYVKKVNVEN
jgi:hypothetical protein